MQRPRRFASRCITIRSPVRHDCITTRPRTATHNPANSGQTDPFASPCGPVRMGWAVWGLLRHAARHAGPGACPDRSGLTRSSTTRRTRASVVSQETPG